VLLCSLSPRITSEPGTVPSSASIGATTPEATAYATALHIHDQSIRTLEWKQRCAIPTVDGPPTLFESTQCFDEQGRWAWDMVITWAKVPEGVAPQSKGHLRFDGHVLHGRGEDPLVWSIRPAMGERFTYMGPDAFLGRWLDRVGQHRLGEMLLEARDLQLAESRRAGHPLLTATLRLHTLVALVEVELSPEHDSAPRRIWVRDRALNVPYFFFEVLEFTSVDGIWLPKRARHVARQLSPMGDKSETFGSMCKEAGLVGQIGHFDPAVQRTYQRIVMTTFGVDEAPSELIAPEQTHSFEYLAVNRPIPADRVTKEYGLNESVFDSIRDAMKDAGTMTWRPQTGSADQ